MFLLCSTLTTEAKAQQISTMNSGVVILQVYIPRLLSALRLTKDNVFVDEVARNKCVLVLDYVVTGMEPNPARRLELFKVLCGLSFYANIDLSVSLTDNDKEVIEGLISAAIQNWPAIGQSSNTGFRENWLVRNGLLFEVQDSWRLIVERRAYDILLMKYPASYSVIRFPWMSKPIEVTWPI